LADQLRVGIIGCGEATQALHVPAINGLSTLYRISACCDVSPEVMRELAERTGSRDVPTDRTPIQLLGD
jgi:predicted dehydrogenase